MNLDSGLKRNKEFGYVFNNGKSVVDRLLVFYVMPNNRSCSRVGFSAGKKLGNAVVRNRVKRIMREIWRNNSGRIKPGYDCILIARPRLTEEKYIVIEKSFLRLLKKAGLLENELKSNEIAGNRNDKDL